MFRKLKGVIQQKKGITGLETAIILIAFVVVASVFSFTVLSTGIFSSERGKEAVLSGLQEVQGSLEMRGSMIAKSDAGKTKVDTVILTLANSIGGSSLTLTAPIDADSNGIPDAGSTHQLVVSYSDNSQSISDIAWSRTFLGENDGDGLLEPGEKTQVTVQLGKAITATSGSTGDLKTSKEFRLELRPPAGGIMTLERTTPDNIDSVMDMH